MNLLKRFSLCLGVIAIGLLVLVGCNFTTRSGVISVDNDRVMYVGYPVDLKVTLDNGEVADITWSIDNESVAKIENGKIIPLKEGSFNLTATYKNESDTLYVVVHKADIFTINYELNGGEENLPLVLAFSEMDENIELVAPVRNGYQFVGFYDNPEFSGEPIAKVDGSMGKDLCLYAKWDIALYALSYELNGGSTDEELPTERNIELPAYQLPQLPRKTM